MLIAEIFKYSYAFISNFVVKFFNRLYSNYEHTTIWREGISVPIFKGGNLENPSNYRGITLINTLGKISSQVLNRLTKRSQENSKIVSQQFGFQSKKTTVDCIFILHAII